VRDGWRVERDTLGEIEVPGGALWGAQTQRAVENFPVSGRPLDRRLVRAVALIKAAAAEENRARGVLDPPLADAIAAAANEVADGLHDDQFPVDLFQTGSGTSSHMNVNEVLANLAIQRLGGVVGSKVPVHPNDHVNLGQSSNDVIPTAVHVAVLIAVDRDLLPALEALADALGRKAEAFAHVVKLGRTHLMDAVPMTLGQEIGGWATQVRGASARIAATRADLARLALGGTAVGTSLGAVPGFARGVIARLAARTGLPLVQADDLFAALASRDALVACAGALRGAAVALTKVANDVRWLASGPRGGLAELRLPELQPGSSIMPGKVNPVLPEVLLQVCSHVVGVDACVAWAGASGNLELNVQTPLVGHQLLEAATWLANAVRLFAARCVDGLEVDEARARALAEQSPAVATALARRIGYDAAAQLAKDALALGRTVRELAHERRVLPDDELERLLDLSLMTHPRG
jgi:fumarate hydratase class II